MNVNTFSFCFDELNITARQLEAAIGYETEETSELLIDSINEILCNAENHCDIQGGYCVFDDFKVNEHNTGVIIHNKSFNTGKLIASNLKHAKSVAIIVCTAGKGITEWSNKLMAEQELIKGYIIDILGSEIVETAINKIQDSLEKEIQQKNLKTTNRYSPGYCGWDVAEQKLLFSLLPDNFCSISLTESSLMIPIKSISGIIGIGKEAQKELYECGKCDMNNCIYREQSIS